MNVKTLTGSSLTFEKQKREENRQDTPVDDLKEEQEQCSSITTRLFDTLGGDLVLCSEGLKGDAYARE
jgi:hypothetical protein